MQYNKKISVQILIVFSIFLTACGKQTVVTLPPAPVPVPFVASPVPPPVVVPASTRGSTKLTASTTLPPDGYFEYQPVNMLDLDYSTAWCSTRADKTPVITLHFDKAVPVKTVGMVTGFGRDETIFNKNNRIKTITAWFDTNESAAISNTFLDKYGMQFFDMPEATATDLHIKITDVYPGSKFKDTCIAEVDMWSDWVSTKDGVAADTYYKDFKFQQAFEPINARDIQMTFAENITQCGKMDTKFKVGEIPRKSMTVVGEVPYVYNNLKYYESPNDYIPYVFLWDWDSVGGAHVGISAKLNTHFKSDDQLEVKWISITPPHVVADDPSIAKEKIEASHRAVAKTCSDGSIYLTDSFTENNVENYVAYRVDLYSKGKLIGRQRFVIGSY